MIGWYQQLGALLKNNNECLVTMIIVPCQDHSQNFTNCLNKRLQQNSVEINDHLIDRDA